MQVRLETPAAVAAPANTPIETKLTVLPSALPARRALITGELLKESRFTTCQQIIGAGGFVYSSLCAAYEFNLGASFGEQIAVSAIKNSPVGLLITQGIFAVPPSITTAALVGLPTGQYLIDLFKKKKKYKRHTTHPCAEKSLDIITHVIAWTCGIPFAYQMSLVYDNSLPWQVVFVAVNIPVSFPPGRLGLDELYFNRFMAAFDAEPQELRDLRVELSQFFENIAKKILAADDATIAILAEHFKYSDDETFVTALQNSLPEQKEELVTRPDGWLKTIMGWAAFLSGIAANYTLADLVIQAVSKYSRKMKMTAAGEAALQYSMAICSTLPNCAFIGKFSKMGFDDLYNHMTISKYQPHLETSHPELRQGLHISSYILGIFAAIPNVALSIEESSGSSYIGIPFAFLGMAMAQAKAIDLLSQDLVSYGVCRFDTDSPAVLRDNLVKQVKFMSAEMYQVGPDEVRGYRTLFFSPRPSPPQKAAAQPDSKGGSSPRLSHLPILETAALALPAPAETKRISSRAKNSLFPVEDAPNLNPDKGQGHLAVPRNESTMPKIPQARP